MYRLRFLLGAFVLAFGSAATLAAELTTPEQTREYANKIILDIGQSRLGDAWAKMKANSTIPPGRIDAFATQYAQAVDQTLRYYGPSIGMELVKAEMSGESVLRFTYLIKYEVTGVSWFLTFYKGRDKWVLTDFNYDINMNSLFKQ